jgi:beta-glucosidase-like glycosyl hydrolase
MRVNVLISIDEAGSFDRQRSAVWPLSIFQRWALARSRTSSPVPDAANNRGAVLYCDREDLGANLSFSPAANIAASPRWV